MASDTVKTLLSLPESRTLEFKRLGSRNESIGRVLESIVAMANTDGGFIVLGIDDPQKTTAKDLDRIFGIEENLTLYDELGRSVGKISPPLPGIWPPDLLSVEGKNVRVGVIMVPKGGDGFRSIENHVFIRGETGNKRLNPQEIVHFAYIKGFQHADRELVDVDFGLLKTTHFDAWRRKRGIPEGSAEDILEKTGLARKEVNGAIKPTRASVLLFAEYPTDILDTKCSIRIFQYEGNLETMRETLNLLGTPKTIAGPIIKQILDAHEYVLTLLRAGIRVPSGFITRYKIPERAVKEAITNAVIHRDYHTKRDIEIKIFEDRVEIESPGLLPFNITPSNIGLERAYGYRNDLLVKHLREFPDPPNLDQNEGIRAMRHAMREAKLYPPIFLTYPTLQDAVRVVLFNEMAPSAWDKVSQFLLEKRFIGNQEARSLLRMDDTVKVSKLLNKWVKHGLLVKVMPRSGAKKNVRYRLPNADEGNLFSSEQSK